MADTRDSVVKIVATMYRDLLFFTNGRVGGRLAGMESLILTTTGRRSGEKREVVLSAPIFEDDLVVLVASWGGGPKHPQWFLNLRADPNVQVFHRGETIDMVAHVAEGPERDELWARATAAYPNYDDYQAKTTREIPVVVLTRGGRREKGSRATRRAPAAGRERAPR
jgi:deazaflavin-dependent oxidoreductase (nitroreductase family)